MFGVQLNFAPYLDSETSRLSVGGTLLYKLIESKITNLFLYQANSYYYNSQMNYLYDPNKPDSINRVRQKESYFNNGIGFGMEIILVKRISVNLMAGYAFYNNFQKLNVTGEAALYYKF